MKTPWETIAGINWRTSLIGFCETIVVLGGAYMFLPESVRDNPLAITVALAGALLKTLKEAQTKDKQVTGTPGTGYIVGPKADETPRYIAPLPTDEMKAQKAETKKLVP